MATLCKDDDDARAVAADSDAQFPHHAPHVVARLEVVPAWQPIETAPDDGRFVLLGRRTITPYIGRYDTIDGWVDTHGNYRDPSHWMPLPAAPEPPHG